MIAIVDYKMGNTGSIQNMLRMLGEESRSTDEPRELKRADRIILPGVGAFDEGMMRLRERGLIEVLEEIVLEHRKPVMGICLGMQLLGKSSEEGSLAGLGWIAANSERFRFKENSGLRIPHMGWNEVNPRPQALLFQNCVTPPRFYFVHCFHVVCEDPADIAATAVHGYEFTASVAHDNIFGVQFHPEKSHRFGMEILRSFCSLSSKRAERYCAAS